MGNTNLSEKTGADPPIKSARTDLYNTIGKAACNDIISRSSGFVKTEGDKMNTSLADNIIDEQAKTEVLQHDSRLV